MRELFSAGKKVRPHARAGVEMYAVNVDFRVWIVRPHARAGVEMILIWDKCYGGTFALMRGRELK